MQVQEDVFSCFSDADETCRVLNAEAFEFGKIE